MSVTSILNPLLLKGFKSFNVSILLAVVLDAIGNNSYLLLLDARYCGRKLPLEVFPSTCHWLSRWVYPFELMPTTRVSWGQTPILFRQDPLQAKAQDREHVGVAQGLAQDRHAL